MSNAFCISFTSLNVLLLLVCLETFLFGIFEVLNVLKFVRMHLGELLLLSLHLSQFFLLEHLHARQFECFAAKHLQNCLDVIVKLVEFVVFHECLF